MKKAYLVFFLIVQILVSYGQETEKKLLIDVTGAYFNRTDKLSDAFNDNQITNNNWKTSIRLNYKISNRIYVGIGFDYLNCDEKQDLTNINIDNVNNSLFVLYNSISRIDHVYTPSINLLFLKPLSDKWSIGLGILNGWSLMNSKYESISAMKKSFSAITELSPSNPQSLLSWEKHSEDQSYYLLSFEPELNYYLSKSVSLKLQITGFRFDTHNKSQAFCFSKANDIFWSLGLGFRL